MKNYEELRGTTNYNLTNEDAIAIDEFYKSYGGDYDSDELFDSEGGELYG